MLLLVTAGGTLAVVVGLFLCNRLARGIATPVLELVHASSELASGNLSVRVPGSRTLELDRLATAFNTMTERIEGLLADVRAKNRILADQRDQLEAANQAMTHFLTTASHELRTPVTNIFSFAEILTSIGTEDAATAEEFGAPGNYVLGANIAGFVRVAEAMRALGVI